MLHDLVLVNRRLSYIPNSPVSTVFLPCSSTLMLWTTRMFLDAWVTSNTFSPSSVREREKIHMYNLALMSCQLDVLWHFECSSPWGREESDTTERLPFHFSLSCMGEGNGNPLYCYCLENPRDGGAWWAAVYEVAQSRTRLKRLSSSSSSKL